MANLVEEARKQNALKREREKKTKELIAPKTNNNSIQNATLDQLGHKDITSRDFIDDEKIFALFENEEYKHILEKGKDLRKYSQEIEQSLHEEEIETVKCYVKEAETLAEMYVSMSECETILEKMEGILYNFHHNIQNIGDNIDQLQTRTKEKTILKENLTSVRDQLADTSRIADISEPFKSKITHTKVKGSNYKDAVIELDEKMNYLAPYREKKNYNFVAEVSTELDRLCSIAVAKLRVYLLTMVGACKDLQTAQQQQQKMMSFQYYFVFLKNHAPHHASRVIEEYVELMGKLYYAKFKPYLTAKAKITKKTISSKNNMIVPKKSVFENKKKQLEAYEVGSRGMVLQSNSFFSPLKEQPRTTYPFPVTFHAINLMLMQTLQQEINFLRHFFQDAKLFERVFAKTEAILSDHLTSYLKNNYDAIELFILILLLNRFKLVIRPKRDELVEVTDAVYDKLLMNLWQRFTMVIDMHITSMTLTKKNINTILNAELNTHTISRRYSKFVHSLLLLNDPNGISTGMRPSSSSTSLHRRSNSSSSEKSMPTTTNFESMHNQYIQNIMKQMEKAYCKLIEGLADKQTNNVTGLDAVLTRCSFIINSYDIVLVENYRFGGSLNRLIHAQEAQMDVYCEATLAGFASLFHLVDKLKAAPLGDARAAAKNQQTLMKHFGDDILKKIENEAHQFESNWEKGMESIEKQVMKSNQFWNVSTAEKIYSSSLHILSNSYSTFTDIIDAIYKRPPFRFIGKKKVIAASKHALSDAIRKK